MMSSTSFLDTMPSVEFLMASASISWVTTGGAAGGAANRPDGADGADGRMKRTGGEGGTPHAQSTAKTGS